MRRTISVVLKNIMMKEMTRIKIFRHHLNKKAKMMKEKKLRKLMRKKRSHLSNYITSTRKTKNSFSKDMVLLKIK
jgi:Mg2+/Co2+ transporter CorB